MKSGAASHPEILQRQDVLTLAIYDALADIRNHILPSLNPLTRFMPLELDFLTDALATEAEN